MDVNELAQFNAQNAKPARIKPGFHPLHEAAMRIASFGKPKANSRTRDLVSMLLAHGARAWRGTQPSVSIHLYVTSPAGRRPVRMHIG
ncbi:hypothetical protein [Rhizobium sp. L1K21]|uniref:hypothetical protein n=1 Tax=Rhizobium sp. L1K21 TaxID=2954933 RepID=UPI0020931EEE|nr:hypothetical protein [Rhizobium sp. L1K21]MCO6186120.1 hypothetical protein [Rhizobium sp. L1K21]